MDSAFDIPHIEESGQRLDEILQICCQAERSGQILFQSGDQTGEIFLQHGNILHATSNGIQGPAAIYLMLRWQPGTFTFNDGILPHRRTITADLGPLLFTAGQFDQLSDEEIVETYGVLEEDGTVDSTRIQGAVPRLTIMDGPPDIDRVSYELGTDFVQIGRVEGNDIILPETSVSSKHCTLIRKGSDIILRDLNSSNGTYVNEQRIEDEDHTLQIGDVIQIGGVQLRFEAGIRGPRGRRPAPKTTGATGVGAGAGNTAKGLGMKPITEIERTVIKIEDKDKDPLEMATAAANKSKDGPVPIRIDTIKVDPVKEKTSLGLSLIIIGVALFVVAILVWVILLKPQAG
ncbi:MAG: FHA domain-containing protein [Candidatus Methylacidiphilales bacterium]|nr:FHA domain-containing protein [Candidatus Methylacidiphilales bacterium]